jgi:hypothetical protein
LSCNLLLIERNLLIVFPILLTLLHKHLRLSNPCNHDFLLNDTSAGAFDGLAAATLLFFVVLRDLETSFSLRIAARPFVVSPGTVGGSVGITISDL